MIAEAARLVVSRTPALDQDLPDAGIIARDTTRARRGGAHGANSAGPGRAIKRDHQDPNNRRQSTIACWPGLVIAIMSKQNAEIISSDNGFAAALDGKIVRDSPELTPILVSVRQARALLGEMCADTFWQKATRGDFGELVGTKRKRYVYYAGVKRYADNLARAPYSRKSG